ncbi:MAG: hypothetical protein M1819_000963 [Sarea resinae]|nr:MAG: hypothetical protein M1819_000963 [Sarea resinae]
MRNSPSWRKNPSRRKSNIPKLQDGPTTPEAGQDGPATPQKNHRLDRDQRIRIQILRGIGWTDARIAAHLKVTQRAVQYACSAPPTPKKHPGRPRKRPLDQADESDALRDDNTASKKPAKAKPAKKAGKKKAGIQQAGT